MSKNTISSESNQTNSQEFQLQTLFNLSAFNKKPAEVAFKAEQTSNDGGLLLLNEIEKHIGLISRMAGCIHDSRHQEYVDHSILSMIKQRVMQIATGYEYANDCNAMRDDDILKVCAGSEHLLASHPTMNRLQKP